MHQATPGWMQCYRMVYGSLFVKCETKRLKLSFLKKEKKN